MRVRILKEGCNFQPAGLSQTLMKSEHLQPDTSRPPAKRSRKAINCEPCRASKLKCDRARPCSSCVLRGTAAACYADKPDSSDYARGDDDGYVFSSFCARVTHRRVQSSANRSAFRNFADSSVARVSRVSYSTEHYYLLQWLPHLSLPFSFRFQSFLCFQTGS